MANGIDLKKLEAELDVVLASYGKSELEEWLADYNRRILIIE